MLSSEVAESDGEVCEETGLVRPSLEHLELGDVTEIPLSIGGNVRVGELVSAYEVTCEETERVYETGENPSYLTVRSVRRWGNEYEFCFTVDDGIAYLTALTDVEKGKAKGLDYVDRRVKEAIWAHHPFLDIDIWED